MNKLDNLLESLVLSHAANLGLTEQLQKQMAKEISICAIQGYNTRAQLIGIVKTEMAVAK